MEFIFHYLPEVRDAQTRKKGGVRIDREQVGKVLRVLRGERVDGVVSAGLQRGRQRMKAKK